MTFGGALFDNSAMLQEADFTVVNFAAQVADTDHALSRNASRVEPESHQNAAVPPHEGEEATGRYGPQFASPPFT